MNDMDWLKPVIEGDKTAAEVHEGKVGCYEEMKKEGEPAATSSSKKFDPKPFNLSGGEE